MTVSDFTDKFIPELAALYAEGELPLHALVDFDLWKQMFRQPGYNDGADLLNWYQVSFTCNPLQDGTVMLSFVLPEPLFRQQAKFAAIRLKLRDANADAMHHVVYYTLRKPDHTYDQWDVSYLSLPAGRQKKMQQEFLCKLDGPDTLRNFVYTVQRHDFMAPEYGVSLFWQLIDDLKRSLVPGKSA